MYKRQVFAVNAQELKKGDKLPDFHLKSAVYGDISSTELKGKVVLVSLFEMCIRDRYMTYATTGYDVNYYKNEKSVVVLGLSLIHI